MLLIVGRNLAGERGVRGEGAPHTLVSRIPRLKHGGLVTIPCVVSSPLVNQQVARRKVGTGVVDRHTVPGHCHRVRGQDDRDRSE